MKETTSEETVTGSCETKKIGLGPIEKKKKKRKKKIG
jgi:hypothetical protein